MVGYLGAIMPGSLPRELLRWCWEFSSAFGSIPRNRADRLPTDSSRESNQKPPPERGLDFQQPSKRNYFFAASAFAVSAFPASLLAYLRRKRSMRRAVSMSFCLPVKKGWHAAQISTPMSPLWVERVTNALPQAQCTRISL